MDAAPDADGAVAMWTFSAADHALVSGKRRANRLSFAVMLAFCRCLGRFPRAGEALGPATVTHIARQVGCDESDDGAAHAAPSNDTARRSGRRWGCARRPPAMRTR